MYVRTRWASGIQRDHGHGLSRGESGCPGGQRVTQAGAGQAGISNASARTSSFFDFIRKEAGEPSSAARWTRSSRRWRREGSAHYHRQAYEQLHDAALADLSTGGRHRQPGGSAADHPWPVAVRTTGSSRYAGAHRPFDVTRAPGGCLPGVGEERSHADKLTRLAALWTIVGNPRPPAAAAARMLPPRAPGFPRPSPPFEQAGRLWTKPWTGRAFWP